MRKHCGLIRCLVAALVAGAALSTPASVPRANPDGDVLLRAMQDELSRSVARLKLKELEKPYFIEYVLEDEDSFSVSATFGALTARSRTRTRSFGARTRVGSYDFDQTGFISSLPPYSAEGFSSPLVVEDNYDALRHDIWLTTDGAYKQALEHLSRKRAYLQNKTVEEKAADFSREEPAIAVASLQTLRLEESQWERRVREWSVIFREFPAIQGSGVEFGVQLAHRYLINSEGTRIRQPILLVSFTAHAHAQTAEGVDITHSVRLYANNLEEFPAPEEVARTIRRMAEELTALRAAPALEGKYLGPALFTGQASAELFAQMLAPHLAGGRPPLTENPYSSPQKSALADRLNRLVLPAFIKVYDDPTERESEGRALLGAYKIDDEGVAARRVSLVEDGVLKNLLMSRRPSKEFARSNGHGRGAGTGAAEPLIGNLFVRAKDGQSIADLKKQLIKTCRAQNLAYGILVKALYADPAPDGMGLSAPLLAYKVYVEDGREELIRGVTVEDISVRALRQIIAAGDDLFVHNTFTGNVPASVVAPAVLLEEVQLNKITGAQQKPTILTHPYFSK